MDDSPSDGQTLNLTDFASNLDLAIDEYKKKIRDVIEMDPTELSTECLVRRDLFVAISLTSLAGMYLRTKGVNPSETIIKAELERVKSYNTELKKSIERNTIRPKLDVKVTKRFIRSGLWSPAEKEKKHKKKKKKN